MEYVTEQMRQWSGTFGREYTDRNSYSLEEVDTLYRRMYGLSRSEMNTLFLGDLDRSLRILEVGANVGFQLALLQRMGFCNLYEIELQPYAVERARQQTKGINLIQGSAFDIPFKDGYFDLVFTSGVLIHIAPVDLSVAMGEMHRCTRHYIWGCEYFADTLTEISYRGHTSMMWKMDYAAHFLELFDDLELAREEHYKYLNDDNVDTMYLLRKRV